MRSPNAVSETFQYTFLCIQEIFKEKNQRISPNKILYEFQDNNFYRFIFGRFFGRKLNKPGPAQVGAISKAQK